MGGEWGTGVGEVGGDGEQGVGGGGWEVGGWGEGERRLGGGGDGEQGVGGGGWEVGGMGSRGGGGWEVGWGKGWGGGKQRVGEGGGERGGTDVPNGLFMKGVGFSSLPIFFLFSFSFFLSVFFFLIYCVRSFKIKHHASTINYVLVFDLWLVGLILW